MKIPILSFFTGAGFLDLGFLQSNFKVVWRNEVEPWFIRGFSHGMLALTGSESESKVHNTHSLIDVGPKQILKEAFGKAGRPKTFGFIGGPPCPDFSIGGKNKGSEGDKGKLSQVYVSRIRELQPSFFLFENVPGLFRTMKHKLFLKQLMDQLDRDYVLDLRILNALDQGAPQDRERVFIIGFGRRWAKRELGLRVPHGVNDALLRMSFHKSSRQYLLPGMNGTHWFPWPVDERYQEAKRRFEWPKPVPFGTEPPKPADIPDELMVSAYICNIEEISRLPNGLEGFEPKSKKFLQIREGDDSRKSFKRLHRWRYSPAAAYGNNEVHLHPLKPRRLTVREALRIQTVPDEFALPPQMPLSHKFKTIGNGVPVKLASAVASSINKVLKGDFNGNF
jgi:DNA (cytosine-5)-methyltransferase 1